MDGIKTNFDAIKAMDINELAVYLADINKKDVLPLEMKRWLESPYTRNKSEVSLENDDGEKQ